MSRLAATLDHDNGHPAALPAGEPVAGTALDAALGLDYGELAVALYFSDMPSRRPSRVAITAEQILALVVQGVERLGVARVRAVAKEYRRHAIAETQPGYAVLGPSPLPNDRRDACAHALAWRLMSDVLGWPSARTSSVPST
jgi:hypothetical protein